MSNFEQRKEAFKGFAEKCKEAIQIYDVVAPVVELKKKGSTYVGSCPFHDEKTPSFSVNVANNYYHCFGCGAKGDAIQFVMKYNSFGFIEAIEAIGKRYNIADDRNELDTPNRITDAKPMPQVAPKIVKPCVHLSMETVKKTLKRYENNHFAHFLVNTFGEAVATTLLLKFKIGSSKKWNGSTIFWYWNDNGATAGKIMLYDPKTGKRDKNKIGSVYSEMKLQKPSNGLFGDWQLENNNKIVAIVESEKTAICMTAILPTFCWVATGGKGFLDFKKSEYDMLFGHKIVLIPDIDGLADWQNRCEIGIEYGFEVDIYEGLNDLNLGANDDILDVALRENWHQKEFPVTAPNQKFMDIWDISSTEFKQQTQLIDQAKEREKDTKTREMEAKKRELETKERERMEYEQREKDAFNAKIQRKIELCETVSREATRLFLMNKKETLLELYNDYPNYNLAVSDRINGIAPF